ncbi:hypothetical protein C2S52_001620 [Perilla frutescens var. hirtella]|nr:hypothetical protein C2S52_001620 [Perilla frutescens var. hirtella]
MESILSKMGELIAACAHNNVNSIKDFEPTLKILQKKLKSLSAKALDVEEEIKNAELSGQKKRKREVEEWLTEVKSIETEILELGTEVESAGFIGRFMGGGKVSRLNEEVDKLVEQSRHFGELLVDVCGTRGLGESLLRNKMVGKAFAENVQRIWGLLANGRVSSIGVHGMGGVGKTTLVKHIHDRLLKQSQGLVVWVTVSQELSIKNLQDKIARSLGVDLLDEHDEDTRAARLHRALSQMRRSVVILDDVWGSIDLVKVGCPFSVEFCRLIITTRSSQVCREIGCQEVIAVQKLDEDEAWKLFYETFTLGKGIKLGPQLEETAKSVARLCDGLLLRIITLAGSMRGETTIHTWRNVLVELKDSVVGQDGMGEVEVFKVLKYSFDRLNRNDESENNEFNLLQLCVLYCSLYPEDKEIPREELIGKLISEGLVDQKKSRRAQIHQCHSILDKLVNVCLLESTVVSYIIQCVKMHDVVRDMAVKICGGKYMIRAGDSSLKEIATEEEWTGDLEKVSLMYNGIRRIGEGTSPDCPNLSTLLLCWNPLEGIPDSFLSKMQGLCTLDLCRTKITMLPDSISELKSLKSLLLEYCRMLEKVPNLGELKALRELNLGYTAITEVPQGVEELLNLIFLSIDAPDLEMLPEGMLLDLDHLQCVRFPQHLEVAREEIENLNELEEFRGRVKNVDDFNCFIACGLSRVHDTFYRIGVGSHCKQEYFELYNKGVTLSKCNLDEENVFGRDIECLTISECEGLRNCFLDDFSRLYNPTSLKRLKIKRCRGIECILTSEQQMSAEDVLDQISTLETIELKDLKDLKGVIVRRGEIGASAGPTQGVFSSLRGLHINKCNKMSMLGLPLAEIVNLELIEIEWCGEIEEIVEDEGRDSVTLPRLKVIKLWGLPRLKSICRATMICNSFEEISIAHCPRLVNKLPLHLDVPPRRSLREIMVEREWWESLEWENPNLPTLLQPLVEFF